MAPEEDLLFTRKYENAGETPWMKWHQAKCTHQESCICDIRSHVLILCTEHETLKRVSDYAQIIKPSPFAWLVGETGYKRWQTSKIKTTLVQFMLETP